MKAAARPHLFLLSWFLCFCLAQRDGDGKGFCAKGTLCAHQVDIPLDEERRVMAVWLGDGNEGTVLGPGLWNALRGGYGGTWYNYTAVQRGPEYCVAKQASPKRETCDKAKDSLSIITSSDTKWDLQPSSLSSGCRRYYLLGLGLALYDSPTRLLWWPGELADKLVLGLGKSSVSNIVLTTFDKIESQPWYDITFQRVPNSIDWRVAVGTAFLLFIFLVIPLVCFWKLRSSPARKMYEDIYMPSPPPSPTLRPSLPSPPLPSYPPPPPPASNEIGGQEGYDDMEWSLLRFQQGMEKGDENSLYISFDYRSAGNDHHDEYDPVDSKL
ncbi:uncharacterized protein LOC125037345 isoform X2 [Penaeus chinensis]|uniref:uncharacterized protein LOC125037345 isoform X2 n=1 Tax=Penaeus chinensis TaxID=139456 RepID=UPI001FB80DD0|nr:uncharacterized protein LOC125037345 isoform X2 [Penaeus chinensis]